VTTETAIKTACAYRNISQANLARAIGMTPANFNQKLKRDTFTIAELSAIAAALDASYHVYLELSGAIRLVIAPDDARTIDAHSHDADTAGAVIDDICLDDIL